MPPAELQRDWPRLRRDLELSQGFAYYLVFTNWPEQNRLGRDYLDDTLRPRSLRLQVVVPDDPVRLLETALASVFQPDLPADTPLWLECWRNGSDPAWNLARRKLMARLNEGRGRLEKEMRRPLILLLPHDGVRRAAEDAPDMWSIRRLVLYLERPAPERETVEMAAPASVEPVSAASHARAERYLADWQRQWRKAQAQGDMGILSLSDGHDAVTALLETGRLSEAKEVAEQALTAARGNLDVASPVTLRNLLISLNKFGDVSSVLGDLEAARDHYTESLALSRRLREELGDTPQMLRDLSISLEKMGNVLIVLGDLEGARVHYTESLALSRRLREELGDTPQMLRGLSISLEKMGNVLIVLGDLEGARVHYMESLALSRQLREMQGATPQVLRDLLVSLDKVGDVSRALGDLDGARGRYTESLALRRQLCEALGDSPAALEDLAKGLGKLAWLNLLFGDVESATRCFDEGRALAARLVAFQSNHPGYARLLTQFDADLAGLRQSAPDDPPRISDEP